MRRSGGRTFLSVFSVISIVSVVPITAASQQCTSPRLLPAYAHNDYRNKRPLHDALALGYQGVEADYVHVKGQLLVAHARADALRGRTLERLYLAPLRERVRRCGWVQSVDRRFLLTIEYKERKPEGYRALGELLGRYADIIGSAKAPGPVRVVLVGWHPTLRQLAGDSLPIAVQARIIRSGLRMPESDSALVGLVSLDYRKNVRWRGRGPLSRQDERALENICRARQLLPGRLIRVYNVPPHARIYELLLGSGVDLIGVRELKEGARILSTAYPSPPRQRCRSPGHPW